MEKLGYHALSDRVAPTHTQVHPLVLVLVKHQDVEPFFFVFQRSLELDFAVFKSHIESLVLHVADAIQGYFGATFPEQDRHNFDVLDVRHFAKVVNVVVLAHQIYIAQVLESAGIVMIAVDHEDRHRDR